MPEEKPKMVFVETAKIPALTRGKIGRNWKELFNLIPVGKAWVVPEEYGSGANIRAQVRKINEELGVITFAVTQRTNKETEETTVYVKRLR